MVCSIGDGRMAVMARLLQAESFSRTIAEEASHQNIAAQYFFRELREADEANLLDEEDMHVFGLKPMSDPLQLVCCNACKKPVKASQYMAHAELCRSLHSIGDTILEVESSMSHKKPPKKDRKKTLTTQAKQATFVERERQELVIANDTVILEPSLEGKIVTKSSFAVEAKETPVSASVAYMADGFGMSPGNTECSDSMMPPAKRSKLIAGKHLPISKDLESSCLTKRMSNQDARTSRGFSKQSISGSERPMDKCGHWYKKHGEVHTCFLPLKDVPVPLATKTYYSQSSNRLRSTLADLYCKASTKELYTDEMSPKISQESMTSLQTSSRIDSFLEEMDKGDKHPVTPFQESDLVLAQRSEVCLGKLGRSPAGMNSLDQVPVDGVSRPEIAPVGYIGSKYLLKPYSFPVNSGKHLGIQQPSGSVPVT